MSAEEWLQSLLKYITSCTSGLHIFFYIFVILACFFGHQMMMHVNRWSLKNHGNVEVLCRVHVACYTELLVVHMVTTTLGSSTFFVFLETYILILLYKSWVPKIFKFSITIMSSATIYSVFCVFSDVQ